MPKALRSRRGAECREEGGEKEARLPRETAMMQRCDRGRPEKDAGVGWGDCLGFLQGSARREEVVVVDEPRGPFPPRPYDFGQVAINDDTLRSAAVPDRKAAKPSTTWDSNRSRRRRERRSRPLDELLLKDDGGRRLPALDDLLTRQPPKACPRRPAEAWRGKLSFPREERRNPVWLR